MSLQVDVFFALLTREEPRLPLAQYAWSQLFLFQTSLPFTMLGGFFQVGFLFWSELIPDQMAVLVHSQFTNK